jgi:hypothetical protein
MSNATYPDATLPLVDGRVLSTNGIFHGSFRRTVGASLLYLVVFEAALFGSGRVLEIGPLTLKMLLFSLTLIYTVWSLLSLDRIRNSTALLVSSFAALLSLGIVNGLEHAADLQLLGLDVSPLLSFLTLPFFELTIRTKRQVMLIVHIIVFAAIVIAAVSTAIMASIWFRIVSFGALYGWLRSTGGEDFVFEGVTGRVFYKGVIFIGIALFFLLFQNGRWSKAVAALLLLALFFIGSRGLFVSLAACALLHALIGPMSTLKKIGVGGAVILLATMLLPVLFSMAGDKTESNAVRLTTISQVLENTGAASAIIGHGFGIGVPERPAHMEITYLEIFQKQGVVGLLWWAALLAMMASRLRRAIALGNKNLAYPLFLSSAFIAFESATNPFLNNPIGMYPLIFALVALGILSHAPQTGPA